MISRVQLQEAFKLALSVTLFYWLALWMDWDMPKYGALAIVLISLGTTGASMHKGAMRLVGTTVGLAVGMVGLALFAQDRWLNLAFLATYLVFVAYFMQVSRYAYAWFVAGFLPPLVWATTYGNVDNAFHYASFRYLETSAGIIIYTVISAVLWPQNAGDALGRQGSNLWTGLRSLFVMYRRQLADGELPAEESQLRTRLAGAASQMLTTLQAAYSDTPQVIARKREWESLRGNVRALGNALVLWQATLEDSRRLQLDRLLPRLEHTLATVDGRMMRISDLWRAQFSKVDPTDTDDADRSLVELVAQVIDREIAADLSHFDRAALLSFVQQLNVLDAVSGELLRTMRALAGLDDRRNPSGCSTPEDLDRPSRWDPSRLINALFPAICFVAGYLFWIYADPPTGPNVPNMAAVFSLIILLTPMRALALLPLLLIATWVTVAPVYFFVMPRLDNGFGLLALIFAYTFVFGLLSGKRAILKTVTLMLFVMMTGISNHQVYSFIGLVDGAMMFLLALSIIAVVQMLIGPARAEQAFISNLRRFFRGCARVVAEYAVGESRDASSGRVMRKRYCESMVLPAPRRLRALEKKLDNKLLSNDARENVRRLIDAVQSLAHRFQALELADARVAQRSAEWREPLVLMGRQLAKRLQGLFEVWSRFERCDPLAERAALQSLAADLEAQLDRSGASDRLDDEALADVYAMLGCARGLIHEAAVTQRAASRINWEHLGEARF